MSTSIREHAEHAERRAILLRLVAEQFPEARYEALWDDGPLVPIVSDSVSKAKADRILVAPVDKSPRIFLYFRIGEDLAEGGISVFWSREFFFRGAHCGNVLESIRKNDPGAYQTIVEEAKRG